MTEEAYISHLPGGQSQIVMPYPVTGVLGDIFTNLLGRQTERTDLRSQSGLGTDLTTSHTEVAREIVSFDIKRVDTE